MSLTHIRKRIERVKELSDALFLDICEQYGPEHILATHSGDIGILCSEMFGVIDEEGEER